MPLLCWSLSLHLAFIMAAGSVSTCAEDNYLPERAPKGIEVSILRSH